MKKRSMAKVLPESRKTTLDSTMMNSLMKVGMKTTPSPITVDLHRTTSIKDAPNIPGVTIMQKMKTIFLGRGKKCSLNNSHWIMNFSNVPQLAMLPNDIRSQDEMHGISYSSWQTHQKSLQITLAQLILTRQTEWLIVTMTLINW